MKKILLLTSLACGLASTMNADIIVQYYTAGDAFLPPDLTAPSVTADNFAPGSGLLINSYSTFNTGDWDIASTTFSDAVAANDFWSWGFDVTSPGVTITLTTMDFRLDRSSTGPDDVEIQATINGVNSVSLFTHDWVDSGDGVTFTNIDISALGSVTTGDSVEFILAAFNSESTGGTFDLETVTYPSGRDSMVINGTIVPEPSTIAAILGLFALGFVVYRRRK